MKGSGVAEEVTKAQLIWLNPPGTMLAELARHLLGLGWMRSG